MNRTPDTFQDEITEAIPKLLELARLITWNKISNHLKFILTEIKDPEGDFSTRRQLWIEENDEKVPVSLNEIFPKLQAQYANLYDVNLSIYKVYKNLTIIEIGYYPKSSLVPEEYRDQRLENPPMIHCKVSKPLWVIDNPKKFDINWEHKPKLIQWKTFWTFRWFMFQRWCRQIKGTLAGRN